MSLSPTEIRDSGLLELYVIGELTPREQVQVESAIRTYPELKQDLLDIEHALQQVAFAKTIPPNPRVLDKTLSTIQGSVSPDPGLAREASNWLPLGLAALTMLLLSASLYLWNLNLKAHASLSVAETELKDCAAKQAATLAPIALLEDLQRSDNQIIQINPTDKFPSTSIFLYNNRETKRNYLTISELPVLSTDQSYQLWSLKTGSDPIPLDVFDASKTIIPVAFEEGSVSYAITIEQKGGAAQPNLDQLLGVFGISG